eukprot:jgi/Ulvmu1/2031/UM120_0027.1
MASASSNEIYPNPIFEGSEKRLEVHFADVNPSTSSTCGLRALDRSTLDSLMQLAACEIVSCMSNPYLDSYVLSESSLFVYPRTWILKTCGTTKLLNCLEKLLQVARKLGLVPCYAKYSRASFLYPDLQPEEYKSFESELDHLRTHLGHIGNGGSAFVLGDKLHGLQWHMFVVAADTAAKAPEPTSNSALECTHRMERVSAAVPLHTMEVCMTDLQPAAAQQFVRTESFVSSKHTTSTTGIRALLPHGDIDDYVFEPCGYSMNGIDGPEHMTIHVTPEDGFSYASCELHGFEEHSFDPAAMTRSITSIFQPGRLVVACATKADIDGSSYLWASSISVPGYSCAGATCQELPTGGRVWFYSLVRDSFRQCPRTLSCPARLSKWPSFASSALPKTNSEDRMDTLTPRSKRAGGTPFGDSGSSGSDMDMLEMEGSPTALRSGASHRGVVTALAAAATGDVLQFAERMLPSLPQDSSAFVFNLAAVSAAAERWRSVLPSVAPLHTVADCTNAAVLVRLQEAGAAFVATTPSDVAAVRHAGIPLESTIVHAAGWKPRDVRAAVSAGARLFAVSRAAELAKLQRFAPGSQLLVVVGSPDAGALSVGVAAAATRASFAVCGVLVSGDMKADADELMALARRVCCELEEEGHVLERVVLTDTGSECCCGALAEAVESAGNWTARLSVCAGGAALVSDAVVMLANVYTVDEEGVHVTDVPMTADSTCKPHAVLLGGSDANSDARALDIMDGLYHGRYVLPPVQAGDWLAFYGGGGMQSSCGGPLFYVDVDDRV